jgi:putative phosphoesterase
VRIALVSDIHSNLPALRAVKAEVERLGADVVICAGDTVGYGGSPNECCDIVAGWVRSSCVGNHDYAALKKDTAGMNPYAALAALWTAENLDEASKAYLGGLGESSRFRVAGTEFAIHHGSPRSIWEYLYEDDISEGMLDEARAQVLVFGHTHISYARSYTDGTIVNPGSVGQPRDGDPRACFALLETDPLRCETVRVEYDIDVAVEAITSAGLPQMLADRLSKGY